VLVIVTAVELSPVASMLLERALVVAELDAALVGELAAGVTNYDVVRHYAALFDVDEYDVLLALDELERAGILRKDLPK
jgi:hypothetical protein